MTLPLLLPLVALSVPQAQAQEVPEDNDEDVVEFEWDFSVGPVLNSGVVLSGDSAGNAVFSAGLSSAVSLGVRAGGRGDDGAGYLSVMAGATGRTETPTGLIPGEANSRTYLGHLKLVGDFDWTGSKNDTDPDFQKVSFALLAGGGPKLSYGIDGERLTDGAGTPITQTVLLFGGRAITNQSSRLIHVAPNLMFTFGGPDNLELPAVLTFSLSTGIML